MTLVSALVGRASLPVVLVVTQALFLSASPATARSVSDDEVRRMMIEDSIRSYSGNCPCPYNLARNGSRCGGRSAYSRPGGASPLCYPDDITPHMLNEYKRQKGLTK